MGSNSQLLNKLVSAAHDAGATDIHLSADRLPRMRVDGQLQDLGGLETGVLQSDALEALAHQIAGEQYAKLEQTGELDLAVTASDVRCRINIYKVQGSYNMAIRLLADTIPALGGLGLPPAVLDFPHLNRGIVLVTGETGSGKSTTLAAILNQINHERSVHIVTLEDPIEYIYAPALASIDQREVGKDTVSFASGLRSVLRQDPDIILIGEMRDAQTIEAALTAAETGHLVFATLHTSSAAESIDRLVGVFPADQQPQIRMQLSTTLEAVLTQQLLAAKEGTGRVLACELMVVNPAIRNLIREGKTPQIANAIATSADDGSITFDNMLLRMVRAGQISQATAVEVAHDRDYVARGH